MYSLAPQYYGKNLFVPSTVQIKSPTNTICQLFAYSKCGLNLSYMTLQYYAHSPPVLLSETAKAVPRLFFNQTHFMLIDINHT